VSLFVGGASEMKIELKKQLKKIVALVFALKKYLSSTF
jgi:hypothetical protein